MNRYKPCGADTCCFTDSKALVERLKQCEQNLRILAETEGFSEYCEQEFGTDCGLSIYRLTLKSLKEVKNGR